MARATTSSLSSWVSNWPNYRRTNRSSGRAHKPRMEPEKHTLVVYCDFSVAYVRVNQHRLLLKLGNMGCPVQMWKWIRSFVMDRRRKYRRGSGSSEQRIVPQGLSQRGTLSPKLWLAYVADLAAAVQEQMQI